MLRCSIAQQYVAGMSIKGLCIARRVFPPEGLRQPRPLRHSKVRQHAIRFRDCDRGGQRGAILYSLIVTAKMNNVDPQAWLADVLARIAEHPAQQIDELLPWNWRADAAPAQAA